MLPIYGIFWRKQVVVQAILCNSTTPSCIVPTFIALLITYLWNIFAQIDNLVGHFAQLTNSVLIIVPTLIALHITQEIFAQQGNIVGHFAQLTISVLCGTLIAIIINFFRCLVLYVFVFSFIVIVYRTTGCSGTPHK